MTAAGLDEYGQRHVSTIKQFNPHIEGANVAKYLVKASYSAEGARGLLKEGGSRRRETVNEGVQALGGKVEAMYFAFGDTDAYVIVDLPDAATATALSLTIGATGVVRCTTTPLITAEEVDEAAKKKVAYRAPGV